MLRVGAADLVQPPATGIGRISATLPTRWRAREAGVRVARHAPDFGQGCLATPPLLAADEPEELVECRCVERGAGIFAGLPVPASGRVAIPDGLGLGRVPSPAVRERFTV